MTVSLSAQASGDHTVTVDSVTLPDGGFVTLHDASLNGGAVLASVVGSSGYLEAGTHENVTVRLDEPPSEDTSLVAMPHRDTNGNEAYDFVTSSGADDGPYAAQGAVVAAAPVSADDSEMADGTTETSTPGFGVAAALGAFLAAALVAARGR